jgi:hypothetical protein
MSIYEGAPHVERDESDLREFTERLGALLDGFIPCVGHHCFDVDGSPVVVLADHLFPHDFYHEVIRDALQAMKYTGRFAIAPRGVGTDDEIAAHIRCGRRPEGDVS